MNTWQPERPDKCRRCGFGRAAKVHRISTTHGHHKFVPQPQSAQPTEEEIQAARERARRGLGNYHGF